MNRLMHCLDCKHGFDHWLVTNEYVGCPRCNLPVILIPKEATKSRPKFEKWWDSNARYIERMMRRWITYGRYKTVYNVSRDESHIWMPMFRDAIATAIHFDSPPPTQTFDLHNRGEL